MRLILSYGAILLVVCILAGCSEVTNNGADLIVYELAVNKTDSYFDGITFSVADISAAAVNAVNYSMIFADTTITKQGDDLLYTGATGPIAAYGQATVTVTKAQMREWLTNNGSIVDDGYGYVGVVIDPDNTVIEDNEYNNTRLSNTMSNFYDDTIIVDFTYNDSEVLNSANPIVFIFMAVTNNGMYLDNMNYFFNITASGRYYFARSQFTTVAEKFVFYTIHDMNNDLDMVTNNNPGDTIAWYQIEAPGHFNFTDNYVITFTGFGECISMHYQFQDQYESDNSSTAAKALPGWQEQIHSLPSGDEDWFTIDVQTTGWKNVAFRTLCSYDDPNALYPPYDFDDYSYLLPNIQLYDTDGVTLLYPPNPDDEYSEILLDFTVPGKYYIRVYNTEPRIYKIRLIDY